MMSTPSSKIVHQRFRRTYGPAANYPCASCGNAAFEWAYQHTDPTPLTAENGEVYSEDIRHYAPMCRSCHRKLDFQKSERTREAWAVNTHSLTSEERRRGGVNTPHPGRAFTHEEAVELGRRGGTAKALNVRKG